MKGREKEIGLLLFEFHMISSVLPCSPCPREHLNATGDCGIAATCCKPLPQASSQTKPKVLFFCRRQQAWCNSESTFDFPIGCSGNALIVLSKCGLDRYVNGRDTECTRLFFFSKKAPARQSVKASLFQFISEEKMVADALLQRIGAISSYARSRTGEARNIAREEL